MPLIGSTAYYYEEKQLTDMEGNYNAGKNLFDDFFLDNSAKSIISSHGPGH